MTRDTLRPLRSYALFAAFVVAATLVVLPAVHGVHAPHRAGAASVEALPAYAAHVDADAPACPLCLAVGQARTAVAPQPALFVPIATTAVRAPIARVAAPPIVAAHAPAAPRAPPA